MGGHAIVNTMRTEGAFLLEWIARNKALGFDPWVICVQALGLAALEKRWT